MSTLVRDQYRRIKCQFSHAILFFRLGDFYALFDEDARIGARELTLTLTAHEFARGERVPLCCVPYHAVETHLARLVAGGYTVAICEQIGDPRTAKGLVEREVVRVVAPSSALGTAYRTRLGPHRNGVAPKHGVATLRATQASSASSPTIADAASESQRNHGDSDASVSCRQTAELPVQLTLFDVYESQPVVRRRHRPA